MIGTILPAFRRLTVGGVSRVQLTTSLYDASIVAIGGMFAAGNIAMAHDGDKVSAGATSAIQSILVPGVAAATLASGNFLIGVGVGGLLLDPLLTKTVDRGLRWFRDIHQARRMQPQISAELLTSAWTMRQRMARDMASSVFNARQWLGREASFLNG